MSVTIRHHDPAEIPEDVLQGVYSMTAAVVEVDFPGAPAPAYPSFAEQMRSATTSLGRRSLWTAEDGGNVVGSATMTFPDLENQDHAVTMIRVHPAERRRGIGSRLLRAALPTARAEGRKLVTCMGLKVGGDGELWTSALGFGRLQSFVMQSLTISQTDPALWEQEVEPGFRIEKWIGAAPQERVAGFAHARTAIEDSPQGEDGLAAPAWTVERVRRREEDLRARGNEQRVVVAVHEATGTIAGLTEMKITPGEGDFCHQQDTAVLEEFRGHGLGLAMKAAMMRWLTRERPELDVVLTNTAADNVHMIRVNSRLGYVTTEEVADVAAAVDRLGDRLDAR